MPGMLVSMRSLTTMERFTVMPASFAISTLPRTPVDMITSSAGISRPSFKSSESRRISAVSAPVRTAMPVSSIRPVRKSLASPESWRCMIFGANSRTVTLSPALERDHAASSPSTPPPITAACFTEGRSERIFATSSRVRTATTCS